jgi:release factor glutamine methyltransferase
MTGLRKTAVPARQADREYMDFRGLSLATAPGRVMTPRPASEKLVSVAIALIGSRPARVVVVGTGSGAIAIWITSPDAVALARVNVVRLGLTRRVSVRRGDLLEPVSGSVDLIVSNLPYLPITDAAHHEELANDPADAVFAPGDGLHVYRRLIAASRQQLSSEGTLAIQLHRNVLTARRDELQTLATMIGGLIPWQTSPRIAA